VPWDGQAQFAPFGGGVIVARLRRRSLLFIDLCGAGHADRLLRRVAVVAAMSVVMAGAGGGVAVASAPPASSSLGSPVALPAPPGPAEWFTETSHNVRNADGSVSAYLYTAPRFHRVGVGWAAIDPSLTTSGSLPGLPVAAPGAFEPTWFGASAGQLLAMQLPGGRITLSSPDLSVSAPSVDASTDTVSYPAAATDTDLQFTSGPSGVSERLILKGSDAPTSFTFHLADPGDALGPVSAEPGGGYLFGADVVDGYHLSLPAPVAYEQPAGSAPDPLAARDPGSAAMTVARSGDGYDITEAISRSWLAGQSYPIVLDPDIWWANATAVEAPSPADCLLRSSPATSQYCGGSWLFVGAANGIMLRSLLQVYADEVPTGSTINDAYAGLYLAGESGSTSDTLGLWRNDQAWDTSETSSATTWDDATAGTAWLGDTLDSPPAPPGGGDPTVFDGSCTDNGGSCALTSSSGWIYPRIIQSMQQWVGSPGVTQVANNGLLMIADGADGTGPYAGWYFWIPSGENYSYTSCPAPNYGPDAGSINQSYCTPFVYVNYTQPPPPPVASVTATVSGVTTGGATVTGSWPAAAGASVYDVQEYQNGSYYSSTETSSTSLSVAGTANDSYSFIVFAGDPGGWSAGTGSNTVTLPPPAPTSVTATAGRGQLSASWPAAVQATSYTTAVYSSTDTSTPLATHSGGAATSDSFTGLSDGAGYYVTVAGCDSQGCSAPQWSNLATLAPDPPASLTATLAGSTVSLSWPASSGATSYSTALYSTASSVVVASHSGLTGTADSFAGLSPGGSFYTTVTACNTGGCSSPTGSNTVTVAPAAPSSVSASAGYQQVAVSWAAVSGATSYTTAVYLTTNTSSPVATHTGLTGTADSFYGLTSNDSYDVTVTACNTGGCGPVATSNTVTLSPGSPASVTATGSGTAVNVSWPAVSGATSYTDTLDAEPAGSLLATHSGLTATADSFTGLTPGDAYRVTLSACSSAGCSPAIQSATVTLAPAAPNPVSVTANDKRVSAGWAAEPGASSYTAAIYLASSPGTAVASVTVTAPGTTFTGLTDGAGYYVTVAACDVGGCTSAQSPTVTPFINGPSGSELFGGAAGRGGAAHPMMRPGPGGASAPPPRPAPGRPRPVKKMGCSTQPKCGEPVDLLSGNLTISDTDLAVPGRGLGLSMVRSYNALAAVSGGAPGACLIVCV